MANETEPRALGAALAAPAFVTRGHAVAMHAADRHVERWAPEAGARRVRSIRSLGFVDRLVAPWLETAQRSGSLRLFHQYANTGLGERAGGSVSWVFPRPWYQDELDWMAAARRAGAGAGAGDGARAAAPTMLTTRGTYVATGATAPSPVAAQRAALPAALHEYVAPSLSLASSRPSPVAGIGFGGDALPRGEAYSPLISLAAVQAAELMTRTVAPLVAPRAAAAAAAPTVTPALRSVLSSILARAAVSRGEAPASRLSTVAPALVTPPAPRPEVSADAAAGALAASAQAAQIADEYAAQRARVAELQRIAQQTAQREIIARAEAARGSDAASTPGTPGTPGTPAAAPVAAPRAEAAHPAGAPSDAARAAQAAAAAELRAAAERAEAQLRQRAAQPAAPSVAGAERTGATVAEAAVSARAEAQRQADADTAAERARAEERIQERIAQRIAERGAAQRLHEQARAEAAAHARGAVDPARVAPRAAGDVAAAARAPAEVIAAIAGLPPELSALLGAVVAQRPERALQAIDELNDSLRTVELLARGSASGAAFEVTRGPRLVMPAGLGGLVSAVDRAQSIAERPAMLAGQRALAPLTQFVAAPAPGVAAGQARRASAGGELRVPHLPWLAAGPRTTAIAATSALGATAAAAPAALTHVAWADRWLARFAGATPQSLDTITASGAAAPAARTRALASAAPGVVFVAPDFLRGDLGADPAGRASAAAIAAVSAAPAPAAAAAAPGPVRLAPPPDVIRFDDEGETPDDVFTAIAAAASRGRSAPARTSAFTPAGAAARASAAAAPQAAAADRPMLADLVAHAAPSAPDAGLSAQLASSPFAAALRHVVNLPSAASFDVRSLFGADLGAVYLAGLIGPATRELAIGAQSAPSWAAWREAPPVAERPDLGAADRIDRIDRIVPGFDAAYVMPEAARAAAEPGVASGAAASTAAAPATLAPAALAGTSAALTTLRSALLSWELPAISEPGAAPRPEVVAATPLAATPLAATPLASQVAARDGGAARRMIDAMTLPMLGEAISDSPSAWSAPGMLAERAQTWSVAQERSASDLALDFVTPELVLAARVYGLGPSEAAQAARLALVGAGQLGAMASTIDRTFVEALAIGRGARFETDRQRIALDGATAAGPAREVRAGAPSLTQLAGERATVAPGEPGEPTSGAPTAGQRSAITTAFPAAEGGVAAALAAPPSSGTAFGVDRRSPRGAFLWPSATVAALGMNAASPDGQLSMSVAALELLAAQVVAELGTYSALSEARAAALGASGDVTVPGAAPSTGAATGAAAAARATSAAVVAGRTGAPAPAPGGEPREADVLGAAAAMVPASRRARFDALYVALGQSSAGLQWSPAARAARALALAGRGDDAPVSARQRAASAWDVLPVVYGGDVVAAGAGVATAASDAASLPADGAASASAAAAIAQAMSSHVAPSWLSGPRAAAARSAALRSARIAPGGREVVGAGPGDADIQVTGSGLAALSARAGQALGSYIAPAAPPAAPRERQPDMTSVGAVLRPPTAEPEYVQTGARTGGRYGGGEPEIPPWFEAAARKMLAERSDNADGISLAELTLVTAAPAAHIAASTRSAPSASPPSPGSAAASQQGSSGAPQIDVEKLANEVYRNILVLMDVARARNGNPYL